MTQHPLGIALIGAGNISRQYLANLVASDDVVVLAITDVVEAAAAERAAEFDIPAWGLPELIWERDDIDLVINLTIPAVHAEVSERALLAGKHVWSEKPLAHSVESGRRLVALAEETGLRLGCAPDTFLGPGLQGAFAAAREGAIGTPRFARAVMRYQGPESWHPNPAFLYAPGAGPLFDMGPYYLTALVHLLGPVTSVVALGDRPTDSRTIATGPLAGTEFPVGTDSTITALLRFESGASASLQFSFDAPASVPVQFEVTGSEGILLLSDPNDFSGAVTVVTADGERVLDIAAETTTRGLGVIEMAAAIRDGRPHAASADIALHVLDIMETVMASIVSGALEPVTTTTTT